MMKYILLTLAVIAAVVALGVAVLFAFAGNDAVTEVPARFEVAELHTLSSEVTQNGEVVEEEGVVEEGDVIVTSPTGRAIIKTGPQLLTSLDSNSEIIFSTPRDHTSNRIEVLAGQVWSRLERALEQDEVYEVYTPTLAAAVRGTSFNAIVTPDREAIVVGEGIVLVAKRDAPNETVRVEAGNTAELIDGELIVRAIEAHEKDAWYLEHMADEWEHGGSAILEATNAHRDGFFSKSLGKVTVEGRGFNQIRQISVGESFIQFVVVSDRVILIPFTELTGVREDSTSLIYYENGTVAPADIFTGSYEEVRQNMLP